MHIGPQIKYRIFSTEQPKMMMISTMTERLMKTKVRTETTMTAKATVIPVRQMLKVNGCRLAGIQWLNQSDQH